MARSKYAEAYVAPICARAQLGPPFRPEPAAGWMLSLGASIVVALSRGSLMSQTITVRGLNEREKTWLKAEARNAGISMEEFVRRMIRRQSEQRIRRECVSGWFLRHFGPEHGVELPPRGRYGYRPIEFREDEDPVESKRG